MVPVKLKNSKSEARISKQIQNTNVKMFKTLNSNGLKAVSENLNFVNSVFEIVSSFDIRISDLNIRKCGKIETPVI